MSAALEITLLCAAALVLAGATGIVAWVCDRRTAATHRAARELAFVLQASTEVCNLAADREIADRENAIAMLDQQSMSEDYCDASHWSPADEDAYQRSRAREREIAASKRGDLLAAARFAEVAGG